MAKKNYREIQSEYLRRRAFGPKKTRPFREYHTPEPIAEKLARLSRVDENGCHIWTGKVSKRSGYGQIDYRKNGRRYHRNAHTAAYELKNGPVPEGKEVSHICPGSANQRCVNPDHLIAETHLENMRRRRPFDNRTWKGLCKKGHILPPKTKRNGNGSCPICYKEYQANYRKLHSEELKVYFREYDRTKRKRSN